MKKRLLLVLFLGICTLWPHLAGAQDLSAYVNSRDEFYVFDRGDIEQVEHLPPRNFKVGYNYVAYTDNKGQFKVYSDGKVHDLELSTPDKYYPMDCFVLIESNNTLTVFQNGEKKTLVFNLQRQYSFSDSMVAFTDYGGDFQILEQDFLHNISRFPPTYLKAGPNNVAYTKESGDFMYFVNGQSYEIHYEQPRHLLTAGDLWYLTQAYELMVFDGQLYTTGVQRPYLVKAMNDAFIYIDNFEGLYDDQQGLNEDGASYSIYYQNKASQLRPQNATTLAAGKNVVVMEGLNEQFQIWYKGETISLENFIPEHYKIARDMVVYTDQDGSLKAFIDGEQLTVTEDIIGEDFEIHGKVIQYLNAADREVIYYKGRNFSTF